MSATLTVNSFIKSVESMFRARSRWEVWSDLITMLSCTIANAVQFKQSREEMYLNVMKHYPDEADRERMIAAATEYFRLVDADPFKDHLGESYMRLELGNSNAGQFFTPYSVCQMMAEVTVENLTKHIEEKGFVTVNDCACGGGATLIAAAEAMHKRGVNYQQKAFFVGQDIDFSVGQMCFVQLSMLGCAGYVHIGNTLIDPMTGGVLFGDGKDSTWYTPMYFHETWAFRRTFAKMDALLQAGKGAAK